ncbi:MAG: hypothetical protein WBQ21_09340 [Solirubrobacteraceae bacterium]
MRLLLALIATVTLAVGILACGGTSKKETSPARVSSNAATDTNAQTATGSTTTPAATATAPSTTTTGDRPKDSNDEDSDSNSDDDLEVFDFGHAASPAQERTIVALVKHYYAASAAGEGATFCSLTFSLIAEAIVEDYGEAAGPAGLRGKTCAVVETKALKLEHKQMAQDAATLEVTGARVNGKKGLALLRFGAKAQPRYIPVRLEFGVWKIHAMSDSRMP